MYAVSMLDFVFTVNLENWTYSTHYFSLKVLESFVKFSLQRSTCLNW